MPNGTRRELIMQLLLSASFSTMFSYPAVGSTTCKSARVPILAMSIYGVFDSPHHELTPAEESDLIAGEAKVGRSVHRTKTQFGNSVSVAQALPDSGVDIHQAQNLFVPAARGQSHVRQDWPRRRSPIWR